ncbi:hypothetical protein CDD83_4730 [Cordyceps sp. RAO-2017]|nr:hypothetical protein CDD83_4730 [Cordyceps sp. RAO-2017]
MVLADDADATIQGVRHFLDFSSPPAGANRRTTCSLVRLPPSRELLLLLLFSLRLPPNPSDCSLALGACPSPDRAVSAVRPANKLPRPPDRANAAEVDVIVLCRASEQLRGILRRRKRQQTRPGARPTRNPSSFSPPPPVLLLFRLDRRPPSPPPPPPPSKAFRRRLSPPSSRLLILVLWPPWRTSSSSRQAPRELCLDRL